MYKRGSSSSISRSLRTRTCCAASGRVRAEAGWRSNPCAGDWAPPDKTHLEQVCGPVDAVLLPIILPTGWGRRRLGDYGAEAEGQMACERRGSTPLTPRYKVAQMWCPQRCGANRSSATPSSLCCERNESHSAFPHLLGLTELQVFLLLQLFVGIIMQHWFQKNMQWPCGVDHVSVHSSTLVAELRRATACLTTYVYCIDITGTMADGDNGSGRGADSAFKVFVGGISFRMDEIGLKERKRVFRVPGFEGSASRSNWPEAHLRTVQRSQPACSVRQVQP